MPTIEQSRQRAKDERLQAHKISDTEYHVYNIVKHTSYAVFKSNSGQWYCTCPFATKGSQIVGGNCKHLQRVLDKELCTTCGSTGSTYNIVDGKCANCKAYESLM